MRDRQPVGNIMQQEVIEATCSSAQVPTVAVVVNAPAPEPTVIIPPNYYPAPTPSINYIPQPAPSAGKLKQSFFSWQQTNNHI